MGVLMEVNDLVVRFYTQEGIVYAVNGVDFSISEGETLGVVGESGSGKSVTMLATMGLLPVPPAKIESGTVNFQGRDLLKLNREQMRLVRGSEVAMIFQDPMTSLNPVLTIGTQLTEGLKLHLGMSQSQAENRAADLLDMVGIPDARRRLGDYPHQFSGGMRQRVMIAIGLSCNPKLLIADEPTTALDVTIQAQIMELIKELKKELGMALIWITHDLGVVAGIADTIQVMYAGRVVERGPVESVFDDTRNAYTKGLLDSLPRMDQRSGGRGARLESIVGAPPDMRIQPVGDPFWPRNPYATERCKQEMPPLRPVENGDPNHYVAAWYNLPEALKKEQEAEGEVS